MRSTVDSVHIQRPRFADSSDGGGFSGQIRAPPCPGLWIWSSRLESAVSLTPLQLSSFATDISLPPSRGDPLWLTATPKAEDCSGAMLARCPSLNSAKCGGRSSPVAGMRRSCSLTTPGEQKGAVLYPVHSSAVRGCGRFRRPFGPPTLPSTPAIDIWQAHKGGCEPRTADPGPRGCFPDVGPPARCWRHSSPSSPDISSF